MRLVLLVSVGGGFAACRHPESRRPVVGVTLPGDSSVYSRDARRGLQQAAESLGFDLSIVTVAGDRDTAGQSSQVAAFVARGVDAIVIAAPGPDAVVGAIGAANHAGIPVFTAGFAVDGGSVAGRVAGDDRQGGALLGALVALRLHGGGNVAIIDQPTLAHVRDRVAGFRQALGAFPNIRVVAAPAVDGCPRDEARRRMNDLLATEQHIDAVFGTDDACALGAMSAIEGAGKSATIVVGFGATAEALAAIARGSPLVADAAPDAGAIGRRLVQAVAARLHGRTKGGGPALVLVPARLVERDSLAPPARAH